MYDEDGSNRRENITDWALKTFRGAYGDKAISKWDIFHYVYAMLHHPGYREKFKDCLKREFPRIPISGLGDVDLRSAESATRGKATAADQRSATHAGRRPTSQLRKQERGQATSSCWLGRLRYASVMPRPLPFSGTPPGAPPVDGRMKAFFRSRSALFPLNQ